MKLVHVKSVRAHPVGTARSRVIAGRSGMDCTAGSERFSEPRWSQIGQTKLNILNSEKSIAVEGTIMSVLPGTMFRVALANEHLVLAHISGKMRKRFIRLTIGDRVRMEMSPYDVSKGRIVYRL